MVYHHTCTLLDACLHADATQLPGAVQPLLRTFGSDSEGVKLYLPRC